MDATDEPGAVLPTVRSVVAGAPPIRRGRPVARGHSGREQMVRGDAPGVAEQVRHTLEAIDYPAFVADLLRGTFEAGVAVSIEQMEAYGELVDEVTTALDDYLGEDRAEPQASTQRQRLLATMVLMGINRIVVSDGRLRPKPDD